MMRIKIILILMFAFFVGGQGGFVSAQVKGSPANDVNVIDYRYQKFNGTLPRFADSLKFRDKIYNVYGAGVIADWENQGDQMSPMAGWGMRVATGYRYTPVHASEIDLLLGGNSGRLFFGVDVNYVMNLNNFAAKNDRQYKLEALFINGLSYRYSHGHAHGFNSGIRLQWNARVNTGFYIESKLNVLTSASQQRLLMTMPSLTAGLTIRYHYREYTLWDYITDFVSGLDNLAIRTNLLYDAAAIPNIGFECNLGKRFSVSADWMYAWWKKDDIGWFWRTYGGELAIKKWFGKNSSERLFTGHHIGLYAQCLTYDFALNGRGQIGGDDEKSLFGKANYGGGIEYGYSLPVSKHINFDFSVGVGYFEGQYKEYQSEEDCYVWQSTKYRHWVGPTKLQISLVYLIGKSAENRNKGGER